MGYKQIDGNKPFLIHQDGKLRYNLRNLPEDSDRILYKREANGQRRNAWPRLVLASDTGGGEDIRLLPEIQLKEHGDLPRNLPCREEDFQAKDGNRLNWAFDNIRYVGPGAAAAPPYSPPPSRKEDPSEEGYEIKDVPEVKSKPTPPPHTEDTAKAKPVPPPPPRKVAKEKRQAEQAAEAEPKLPEVPTPQPLSPDDPELLSDLQKGSGGLTAKAAIKVINDYDFEELQDAGFYTEDKIDNPRKTVEYAWQMAEKQYREEMKK